jgi:hypothetical protein
MTGKQIIDLASADSFNEGDLMLIRKSGAGVDKKIIYSDFVESIGNSSINGYTSALEDACENKIILQAANNAPVYKYYEGMKVSFTAPAKTTGIVQIRIGELEYKNLCQYKSDIAASLEENDYIEAIFIEKCFYQVNDLKTLIKEQVIDLDSVESFSQDDALLVRKSGTDTNTKIDFSAFIESIGNPAINGYTAELDREQANKIILKAANNAPVYKYCQGMKISFVAPAKTNGVVQIRIGELAYKNLYRYQSDVSVSLDQDDYIEALLIDEHFYQINDLKTAANVYTNDYVCIDHKIHKKGVSTDLTLVTAYGLHKREYYNGMSVTFMCPVNTKGAVKINIDGLGTKDIIEGDIEDFLYTPLYKGQIVHAIYNGVCFVKNKFQAENPKIRQSLEPCPTSSIEGKPQSVIPLENILEFNVGSGSSLIGSNIIYHFPTLRAALEEILSKYSDTSGRRVILNILTDLTTSKDSVIIKNRDLSWITIKGDTKNKIFISCDQYPPFFTLTGCTNFNFAKNTVITASCHTLSHSGGFAFFELEDCNFSMQDVTLDFLGLTLDSYSVTAIATFQIQGGVITMNNVISKNATKHFTVYGAKKSIISLTNCKFTNYSKTAHNIDLQSPNSELTLTNCDLSKKGTSGIDDIYIIKFATVTQINSRAKVRYQGGQGICLPNTSDQYATYIVTGSQDKVGTDN